jgi:hypothetical protein
VEALLWDVVLELDCLAMGTALVFLTGFAELESAESRELLTVDPMEAVSASMSLATSSFSAVPLLRVGELTC